MIFGLSLRSLWRWRVVVPGLLLAVSFAAVAWFAVPPTLQRTATLLLVPGAATVPDEGNPYFYLAGLTQAADVVVRAVGSENVQRDVANQYPGVSFQVARDPTTAGPVMTILVNASSDADAEAVVSILVTRASADLEQLQVEDNILPSYRIQIRPISIDDHSTVRNRTRLVAAAGVGFLGVLAVALVAFLVALRAARGDADEGDNAGFEQSDAEDPMESADSTAPAPDWGWVADPEVEAADELPPTFDADAAVGGDPSGSDQNREAQQAV